MVLQKNITMIIVLLGVVGCASAPTPQNAGEYRESIKSGGYGTEYESYEVSRPFSVVSKTLKEKSNECLNIAIQETHCIRNGNCSEHTSFYSPTVVSGENKTELHVQYRREPWDALFLGGEPPADGMYIAVVDVQPAGNSKTKVDLYGLSVAAMRRVPEAIKHWVDGSNLGCPNLTKPYYD